MWRPRHEHIAGGDLIREVYVFTSYDDRVHLAEYRIQERATKRHKWRTVKCWYRLDKRASNIDKPTVPEALQQEALEAIRNLIAYRDE